MLKFLKSDRFFYTSLLIGYCFFFMIVILMNKDIKEFERENLILKLQLEQSKELNRDLINSINRALIKDKLLEEAKIDEIIEKLKNEKYKDNRDIILKSNDILKEINKPFTKE